MKQEGTWDWFIWTTILGVIFGATLLILTRPAKADAGDSFYQLLVRANAGHAEAEIYTNTSGDGHIWGAVSQLGSDYVCLKHTGQDIAQPDHKNWCVFISKIRVLSLPPDFWGVDAR